MARDFWKTHTMTPAQRLKIEALRKTCEAAKDALGALPAGRERALAITKLEESFMWAERCLLLCDADEKA